MTWNRCAAASPGIGTTIQAIEQYLMHFVPADGDSAASEFEDLADLFERAAADGTPIREIVGDDPVEFVETFAQKPGAPRVIGGDGRDRLWC